MSAEPLNIPSSPPVVASSSHQSVPIRATPGKAKAKRVDRSANGDEWGKNIQDPGLKVEGRKIADVVERALGVVDSDGNSMLSSDERASDDPLTETSSSEDEPVTRGKPKTVQGKQTAKRKLTTADPQPAKKPRKTAATSTGKAKKSAASNRATDTQTLDTEIEEAIEGAGPNKRKRKTAAEKEAEAMPLATRTPGLRMFVGAHTSIAKGVENAITNAVHIGGNSFACFLKSQRKWDNPSLQDANREAFKQSLITHRYDGTSHIVPHGSYLVNLATEDPELAKKSYSTFLDDLQRCEALGIKHYNFHPGAAGKSDLSSAIARLAANLNRALSETSTVVPLLENMASRGTVIGGRFSDLSSVIALIEPQHKHRIGVCIDTCHAFASGYDLRTLKAFKATLDDFDKTVGIQYLKALHLNDSKAPLASGRDLHQNVGLGFLGLRAFHSVMNEPRFENLPLILETPCEKPDPKDPKGKKTIEDKSVWAKEIKMLENLIGMDAESVEFKKLEKELAEKGKAERATYQKAYDEKLKKENKKLEKEREKGQKSVKDMFGGASAKDKGKGKEKAKEVALPKKKSMKAVATANDKGKGKAIPKAKVAQQKKMTAPAAPVDDGSDSELSELSELSEQEEVDQASDSGESSDASDQGSVYKG